MNEPVTITLREDIVVKATPTLRNAIEEFVEEVEEEIIVRAGTIINIMTSRGIGNKPTHLVAVFTIKTEKDMGDGMTAPDPNGDYITYRSVDPTFGFIVQSEWLNLGQAIGEVMENIVPLPLSIQVTMKEMEEIVKNMEDTYGFQAHAPIVPIPIKDAHGDIINWPNSELSLTPLPAVKTQYGHSLGNVSNDLLNIVYFKDLKAKSE